MEARKLDASAPWYEHCHKLAALFEHDEDVTIGEYDEDTMTIKVYVRGKDKAEALGRIIAPEVNFDGKNVLKVVVVPDNDGEPSLEDTLCYAFNGNPLYAGTATVELYGGTATYAVFEPAVIQYWNDNIGSCFGFKTETVEDVAREVLNVDAFICTDVRDASED